MNKTQKLPSAARAIEIAKTRRLIEKLQALEWAAKSTPQEAQYRALKMDAKKILRVLEST